MTELHVQCTLIIHEKDKARQGNTTTERQSHTTQFAQSSHFSKKKLPALGGTRTHNTRILGNALTN